MSWQVRIILMELRGMWGEHFLGLCIHQQPRVAAGGYLEATRVKSCRLAAGETPT